MYNLRISHASLQQPLILGLFGLSTTYTFVNLPFAVVFIVKSLRVILCLCLHHYYHRGKKSQSMEFREILTVYYRIIYGMKSHCLKLLSTFFVTMRRHFFLLQSGTLIPFFVYTKTL
jgi:hypothetical protein